MKKAYLFMLSFSAFILLSLAFTNEDDSLYKNLKVLPKNITKEQMDSVMHHFTASLNVKCNFCHVKREGEAHPDFASDDNKHKLVAREMMKMTDKINDKYFNISGGKKNLDAKLMVTCYTCHHGATDPATKAPKPEPQTPPSPSDSTKTNQ
jgi:hypothetical protein